MAIFTLLKRDHFDNSTVDPTTYPGNGVITEPAGTTLILDGPNSQNCDWWYATHNAPHAYYTKESFTPEATKYDVFRAACRLSNVASTTYAALGGLVAMTDRNNAWLFGLYYNDPRIRIMRQLAGVGAEIYNSGVVSSPATTPHQYRVTWNSSGKDVLIDGEDLENGKAWFEYSVDDGATWVLAATYDVQFDFDEFGVGLKKWTSGAGDNAQYYFDWLDLYGIEPDDPEPDDYPVSKGLLEDDARQVGQGGPPTHGSTAGQGQLIPGPVDQSLGSIGPFDKGLLEHDAREVDLLHLDRVDPILGNQGRLFKGFLEENLEHFRSVTTDYHPGNTDGEGHSYFIAGQCRLAVLYDTIGELWRTPTDPAFTGYGKDGHSYVGGVLQGGGPHAPWALESASNDRSSRDSFPNKSLIVYAHANEINKEIVIFDLDNYPTAITTWMRFKFNSGNNPFWMAGNENRHVESIAMANGVLVVGTKWGSDRGWVHIIDFKASGQDCCHVIGSNQHYKVGSGETIATRNGAVNLTTTGVSPSLRVDSEEIYSLAAQADGMDTYIAAAGEDIGPHIIKTTSGVPQSSVRATGEVGSDTHLDPDGNVRRVYFDRDGWLWVSHYGKLYRNTRNWRYGEVLLHDRPGTYKEGGYPTMLELPSMILAMVHLGKHLYVTTERGIYQVDRGTMESHLTWTLVGLGGTGADGASDGEQMIGEKAYAQAMHSDRADLSGFLAVATRHGGGAAMIIRDFDDYDVAALEYDDLHEPGCWFNIVMVE
jgi:hypothetical protein